MNWGGKSAFGVTDAFTGAEGGLGLDMKLSPCSTIGLDSCSQPSQATILLQANGNLQSGRH